MILAESLPGGATRCVVARPRMVARERRSAAIRVSRASPLAWDATLDLDAYASAASVRRGASAPASSARFGLARTVAAAAADLASAGLSPGDRIDESCIATPCPRISVHAVAARTLAVEVGRLAGDRETVARCVELARANPDAIEVSVQSGSELSLGRPRAALVRIERVLRADRAHLAIETRQTLRNAAVAEAAVAYRDVLEEVAPLLGPALADRLRVSREGQTVTIRARLLWEDLELAAADNARLEAAVAEQDQARRPRPVDEVDVADADLALEQLDLRLATLATSPIDARRDLAAEARALAERALGAHPGDDRIRGRLYRLLIDELADARAAAAVAEQAIVGGAGDRARWQLARRRALAHVDTAALARLLSDEHVVGAHDAARASRDLVAATAAGGDYERVEGLWVAALAIEGRVRVMRSWPTRAARLPLSTAPMALVALAGVAADSASVSRAAYLTLAGAAVEPLAATRNPADEVLVTHGDGGRATLVAATTTTAAVGATSAEPVGRALSLGAVPGELEISVAVVPFDAVDGAPSLVLVVRGHVEGASFVVERASLRNADFGALARYLARPLLALEPPALFPPPAWSIETERADEARELAELALEEPGVDCRADGLRVECQAHPDDPAAARRALYRVAGLRLRARLGGTARPAPGQDSGPPPREVRH